MDNREASLLFQEICEGFSVSKINSKKIYVKHLTLKEFNIVHSIYEDYYSNAIKKNIPNSKDLFESLKETGQWTEKDEENLSNQELEIKNLKQTLKKVFRGFEKESISKRLKELEPEFKESLKLKKSFLRVTAEHYAEKKSNEEVLRLCTFKDAKLEEKLWTEEEFQDLDYFELNSFFNLYSQAIEKFSDKNIMQTSLFSSFKNLTSIFDKDLSSFFNKPVLQLSFYQTNLLNYSKMFQAIFENREIPKDIQGDAEKIINFIEEADAKKDKAEKIIKKSQESDGFSFAKLSNEEMKELGVEKPKGKDIHKVAQEKGGELTMEDFMKMHKK